MSRRSASLGVAALLLAAHAHAAPDTGRLPVDVPVRTEPRDVGGEARSFTVIDVSGKGARAILEYDKFDVGANEGVQFIQANERARLMNRILDHEPTHIDGQIQANGGILFVNPAGVIFGPTAVVNAASIYAAAGAVSDADFLRGDVRVTGLAGPVENQGVLRAEGPQSAALPGEAGVRIALFGRSVFSTGTLAAPEGSILLVSGEDLVALQPGSEVSVRVDGALRPGSGDATSGSILFGETSSALAVGDLYALATHRAGFPEPAEGEVLGVQVSGSVEGQLHVLDVDSDFTEVFLDGPLRTGSMASIGDLVIDTPSVELGGDVASARGGIDLFGEKTITVPNAVVAAGVRAPSDEPQLLRIQGDLRQVTEGESSLTLAADSINFTPMISNLDPGNEGDEERHGESRSVLLQTPGDLRINPQGSGSLRAGDTFNLGDEITNLEIRSGGDVLLGTTRLVGEGDVRIRATDEVSLATTLVFGTLQVDAGRRIRLEDVEGNKSRWLSSAVRLDSPEVEGRENIDMSTLDGQYELNGTSRDADAALGNRELLRKLILVLGGSRGSFDGGEVPPGQIEPIPDVDAGEGPPPPGSLRDGGVFALLGCRRSQADREATTRLTAFGARSGDLCFEGAPAEEARRIYKSLFAVLGDVKQILHEEARLCRETRGAAVLSAQDLRSCVETRPAVPESTTYLARLHEFLRQVERIDVADEERRQTVERVMSWLVPDEMTVGAFIEAVRLSPGSGPLR